jgi:peptidoglycan/xylan/chitin deacetylase (PgdA/CDA1 family)
MRRAFAASFLLASIIGAGTAQADDCPPGALGVSRTIVVDPTEHPLVGGLQYGETLPLDDKEVVLTFDDGPLPPYTEHILETLASECVKATFFMVGRMANNFPALVRRVHREGHTIGSHSQNHPLSFRRMSVDQAAVEIQEGFASLRAALGDSEAVAPFFRIPGLLRQTPVEQYLAAHEIMTWSLDVVADDWRRIGAQEIARRAVSRLEAHGKGVLLLHDIHKTTALALPIILRELKARGFKIVHVVPALPDRPKTVTKPEQWAAHRTRKQMLWPRVVDVGATEAAGPPLRLPSPQDFGLAYPAGRQVEASLSFSTADPGEAALPPVPLWPEQTHSGPPEAVFLAAPVPHISEYMRIFSTASNAGPESLKFRFVTSSVARAGTPNRPNHQVRQRPIPIRSQAGRHAIIGRPPFGHQL